MNMNNLKLALDAYHSVRGYLSRSKPRKNSDEIHGRISFTAGVVLVGGAVAFDISDLSLGSATLIDLGKIYRYYRFNRIEFEFPAPQWSTGSILFASYSPSAQQNAVTYSTDESQYSVMISANSTVSKKLVVPAKALHPQLAWLLTTGDATDPNLAQLGHVNFSSLVSSNETIDIKITIDFSYKTIQDPTEIGLMLQKSWSSQKADVSLHTYESPGKGGLVVGHAYRKNLRARVKQENSNND
jgi:hypothetical protein